jgi:hypothetical protein
MPKQKYIDKLFDEVIIQQCILNTFYKRLWGAWKVLRGKAGIILLEINPKDFYKK